MLSQPLPSHSSLSPLLSELNVGPFRGRTLYVQPRLTIVIASDSVESSLVFLGSSVRILFVASEGLPFSKTGGLADVVEALPKALVGLGHEVAVVLPRYRGTKASSVAVPSVTIPMGGTRLRFPSIADGSMINGVRYFFVDDPAYFDRDDLYGGPAGDYPDNAERFSEFGRTAIEIAKHVWRPDVIHCHDWQSALVPVLLRTFY